MSCKQPKSSKGYMCCALCEDNQMCKDSMVSQNTKPMEVFDIVSLFYYDNYTKNCIAIMDNITDYKINMKDEDSNELQISRKQ